MHRGWARCEEGVLLGQEGSLRGQRGWSSPGAGPGGSEARLVSRGQSQGSRRVGWEQLGYGDVWESAEVCALLTL